MIFRREGEVGDRFGTDVGASLIYSTGGSPGSSLTGTGHGAVLSHRAGSYEFWAHDQGSTFTNWKPGQDHDCDGQSNLVEFCLGSDPQSGVRGVFDIRFDPTGSSGGGPAILWARPALPYWRDLVDFRVEGSNDLASWRVAEFEELDGSGDRTYPVPSGSTSTRWLLRLAPAYPWFEDQSGSRVIGFP